MKYLICLALLVSVAFIGQAQIDHWEAIVLDGTTWSYHIPVEQPVADWLMPEFDDATWPTNISGFGYTDGDDNTIIDPTMSLYLRHQFDVADLSLIDSAIFIMDYDDGFVAYLNGVEIARGNAGAPGEFIAWNQDLPIDQEAVLYQGGIPEFHPLDYETVMVEGTNTLSIEVHNANPGSSDLTARPFLMIGVSSEEVTYSATPDWFVIPEEPCDNPNYVVVLNTGEWAYEMEWYIETLDGELVVESEGGYENWTLYQQPVCLEDGCYSFWMVDTYGDGWNGGSFELQDLEGNFVLSGQLYGGFAEQLIFQFGDGCEILGCTDPAALNYWQFANVDDGSCVVFADTNLPIVILTTDEAIPDDPRIIANMGIINNADGLNNVNDPFTDYNGNIAIELRGSSSQSFPKKSYGLETQDSLGFNNNVELIDMPAENDWILHGPYTDKTMMRNTITFQLGRDVGRYTPRTRYCELLINGDYRGVYMLMENIKRDANRVDIATLLPEDTEGNELTGGYILKVDKFTGDFEGGWTSPHANEGGGDLVIQFHKPEMDDLNLQQTDYIQDHVTAFEDALAGDDFADSLLGYAPYIDVRSFIDLYLINELSKNIDGYRLSTYFYKQKDSNGGKIVMGPWWDYNLSFGNADYCECWDPTGFEVNTECGWNNPFWFERLLEDPAYSNLTRCVWEDYRAAEWSNDSIHSLIDSLGTELAQAQVRDHIRWPRLGQYVWPNWYIGDTYDQEIDFMTTWIDDRLTWLDDNIAGACVPGCMDPLACNYFAEAIYDNGTCTYPELFYDCEGACLNDLDSDEVCDELDNCPEVYNPLQVDTDGDGFGDLCQPVGIDESSVQSSAQLLYITNAQGQRVPASARGLLFFHYEDGSVERRVELGRGE